MSPTIGGKNLQPLSIALSESWSERASLISFSIKRQPNLESHNENESWRFSLDLETHK